MAVAGPGRVLPALPARAPRRGGQRRGARRAGERGVAAGREPHARGPGAVPARARRRTADGDARQAAAPASARPPARGAGDLEPGADRRAARRRGRARDPGDGEPRPRGARRGQGADPGRRDGVRGARALEGPGAARGPSPPGHGGVRGRGVALGQPRAAAHVAGLRARHRVGARPGRVPRHARQRVRRRHDHRRVCRRSPAAVRSPRGSPSSPVSRRRESLPIAGWRKKQWWNRSTPSGWCSRTRAVSTRRSRSAGSRRSGARRSSRWPSTSARCPTPTRPTGRPIRQRAFAAGAIEAQRRRRARRVRERVRLPRDQGERALRGQVPAGVRAVPPGHRPPPRGRRPRVRRRRRRARLHREGQRPGALRGERARAGAGPRRARARAGLGLQPPGLDRVRRPSRHPDHRHRGEAVLDRREHRRPGDRVRRDGGPVGRAARGRLRDDPRGRERAARAARDRAALRPRRARSRSTARCCRCTRSSTS